MVFKVVSTWRDPDLEVLRGYTPGKLTYPLKNAAWKTIPSSWNGHSLGDMFFFLGGVKLLHKKASMGERRFGIKLAIPTTVIEQVKILQLS